MAKKKAKDCGVHDLGLDGAICTCEEISGKVKPRSPYDRKTTEAALWACEMLMRAYKNGEEAGGSIEWDEVDLAHQKAVSAVRRAKKEGYVVD